MFETNLLTHHNVAILILTRTNYRIAPKRCLRWACVVRGLKVVLILHSDAGLWSFNGQLIERLATKSMQSWHIGQEWIHFRQFCSFPYGKKIDVLTCQKCILHCIGV